EAPERRSREEQDEGEREAPERRSREEQDEGEREALDIEELEEVEDAEMPAPRTTLPMRAAAPTPPPLPMVRPSVVMVPPRGPVVKVPPLGARPPMPRSTAPVSVPPMPSAAVTIPSRDGEPRGD